MNSNQNFKRTTITFEYWVNKSYDFKVGFVSVYDNEAFDMSKDFVAYELGRQVAIIAKIKGHKTKGTLIRRKANSSEFAWVKTKMRVLEDIAWDMGFKPEHMAI